MAEETVELRAYLEGLIGSAERRLRKTLSRAAACVTSGEVETSIGVAHLMGWKDLKSRAMRAQERLVPLCAVPVRELLGKKPRR